MEDLTKARVNNWMGTWNNPPINAKEALEDLYTTGKATYLVG